MKYKAMEYPHSSVRNIVYSKNAMVATSNPSAASAGLNVLREGGNAVDAAIAAAATMVVTEPTCNGLGSDMFAILHVNGKLHGINASGKSPSDISLEKLREKGYDKMPQQGVLSINVPGAVAGWVKLSEKFGNLPFERLLKDAIEYAEEGFAVSPKVADLWNTCFEKYSKCKGEEFKPWFETYAPKGRAPFAGEIFVNKDIGKTLKNIAKTKGESFYKGEEAQKIAEFVKKYGGYLSEDDLKNYEPLWVDPISTSYRGYDIWEMPPNGHGITVLMTLKLLSQFNFDEKDEEAVHKQIEALKLAYIDAKEYVADREYMKVTVKDLLSDNYMVKRRELIGENALYPQVGTPGTGSTIYLATADKWGNMVSLIQSNYEDFGSGIVIPGTSIALNNRGANFNFIENHPNCLGGGKRSYHTIIPGFITKQGKALGAFGVMGGFMQPQGHVQVLTNMIDFNLNPQSALDMPRWQWTGEKRVEVEKDFPKKIIEGLKKRGHEIMVNEDWTDMGRGQIIIRNEDGVYCGGTEKRTDGTIASW